MTERDHLHVDSRFQLTCMFAVMILTPICILCLIQPRDGLLFGVMTISWFFIGYWLATGAYKLGEWLRNRG